eukprot:7154130-Lingulodinium_polyedra.AAC.1
MGPTTAAWPMPAASRAGWANAPPPHKREARGGGAGRWRPPRHPAGHNHGAGPLLECRVRR